MTPVKLLLNLIGWLQIVLGSTAIGAIIGGLCYYLMHNRTGDIILLTCITVGGIVGMIWATRIWILTGTVEWLSRIRRIS